MRFNKSVLDTGKNRIRGVALPSWSDSDRQEFDRIWDKITSGEDISPEEESAFKVLFAKKHEYVNSSGKGLSVKYLAQALELVDDLKADGAVLSTNDAAEMIVLLYTAGDEMIHRFALIKKAGRIKL